MLNKKLIQTKMANIDQYLRKLKPLLGFSASEILRDELKLHTVERIFQLIVDTMVDINTHIITSEDFPIPEDYQSTFITLGQQDILPMDFAIKLAPVVGLRNRVVHKYEDLDLKLFLKQLKDEVGDSSNILFI